MISSRSLTLIVLGGILFASGCDRATNQPAQPRETASEGDSAPALTGTVDRSHKGSELPLLVLKDAAGEELKLASLKGKPLLLNLWATWCAPCVAELPTLARLAAGDKVAVVTVSQDLTGAEKIAPFLAAHGAGALPGWLDRDNDLAQQYDAQTLPTTVYYDAAGREVWRLTGGHDWSGADTAALLAEAR